MKGTICVSVFEHGVVNASVRINAAGARIGIRIKLKIRKHQQSRYIATVIGTMHRPLLTVIALCSYETDDLFVSFLM